MVKYKVKGAIKMGEIKVRGLDETVILRLNELAQKKGKSRETYIRDSLINLSLAGQLFEMDFKYATLVETLADKNQMLTDIIEKNNFLLEELLERMNDEDD